MKTQRRLELLLEDLPCEYDPWDYYETSDQILEPLLLCYDSLVISLSQKFMNNILMVVLLIMDMYIIINFQQSCGSGMLADGRLADLIRRVTTFGMGLMKLDLRQVCVCVCVWFWLLFALLSALTEFCHVSGIW